MRMDLRITLGGFIALAALQFATMGWLRADIGQLQDGQASLREGQAALRADVGQLRDGQASLRDEQATLSADIGELREGQAALRADVAGIGDRLAGVEQGQVELAAKQSELGERMARFEGTLSTVVALYDRASPEESARRDDGAAPEQGG